MGDRVLVAGVGNIFNGDDGFGSAVVGRLLAAAGARGRRVVDYGIRGVHLAFDLADGVETLILVDTVPDAGGGPGSVAVHRGAGRARSARPTFDAHDLDPNAVFRSLGTLGDEPAADAGRRVPAGDARGRDRAQRAGRGGRAGRRRQGVTTATELGGPG